LDHIQQLIELGELLALVPETALFVFCFSFVFEALRTLHQPLQVLAAHQGVQQDLRDLEVLRGAIEVPDHRQHPVEVRLSHIP